MILWISIVCIGLAGLIGFSAHRASLCSVRAVEELLTTRRGFMLASFVKSSLWVMGATLLITLFVPVDVMMTVGKELSLLTLVGGLLFGVGATINGGCAFSTLTRLGGGNIGVLLSLVGFVVGAALLELIPMGPFSSLAVDTQTGMSLLTRWHMPLAIALSLWMLWELAKLRRSFSPSGWKNKVTASHYRLSTAALLMGVSNAILYVLVGAWPYTYVLGHTARNAVTGAAMPAVIYWLLFVALVVGVFLSAWQGHRFRLVLAPNRQWLNYLFGGVLMGAGAGFIPGGNDVLMFQGLPSLSPHALPAFVAMMIGIALTLTLMRLLGRGIPVIDCGNDICAIDDK
ncbi:YeeE/YedE family protein [Sneathiella marina]|uniref:YeeE/YedE family protein n=1 Tax=Sneathiella marina TaxID=2950108 RepID=A0ABY4W6X6_9PROT|nr:YeeE/YedE thiosulfate transporter family protein [Sneathiella marina]USG62579.1 YeeE/YedE family protein [Sneathiella marina]